MLLLISRKELGIKPLLRTLHSPRFRRQEEPSTLKAIYLSSWEKKMVNIPETGSKEELEFEKRFEDELRNKR